MMSKLKYYNLVKKLTLQIAEFESLLYELEKFLESCDAGYIRDAKPVIRKGEVK